jgi:lipopolysaccharide export system protein LptA
MKRSAQVFAVVLALLSGVDAALSAAVAQRDNAVLPGGSSKEPVSIDAAKLDYFDKEQKLVYSGAVVATQGQSRLQASVLVIFLEPATASSSGQEMRRMEAQGPVTVVSKDQIGTGDSGVYERAENRVVLTGHVTLSQGANVTKGERLVYDLATKQAVVLGGAAAGGRVRSVFTPNEKSGAQPAPATSDATPQTRPPAAPKAKPTRAEAARAAD